MDRRLNPNPQDFINEVEKFSKRSLNRKAEMITIYEAAVDSNQVEVYRDLCFTAKYLIGMIRVLKEGASNPQVSSLEHVKKDFASNMNKGTEQLKQIISNTNESTQKYFEEEFLEKSHSGLTNLNELLLDLESAKLYLNHLKREVKE
jgi:hypothetical protein